MLKGFFLSILIGPVVPEPAPAFVVEALTSAQVTTSAGSRSGFELSFPAGKNSKIISSLLPAGYFDPPTRVILVVTLNGTHNVIMDGVITRHEVTPGNQPGQSTLVITGEDLSRMMDLIDF